jgi:hypothetical protein
MLVERTARFSLWHRPQRKHDGQACPRTRRVAATAGSDVSPMLLDDGRTQPKPDAGSFQILGSEEGIEDSFKVLRCNADPVIGDGDPNRRLLKIGPHTAG